MNVAAYPIPAPLPSYLVETLRSNPALFQVNADAIAGIYRPEKSPTALREVASERGVAAAAMEYYERGFSVIPLVPRGKKPIIRWTQYQVQRATPKEVTGWFPDDKNNLAIATGKISGLVVVDFDTNEAIEMANNRNFPKTPLVKTGKGYHAYCRYREGVRNFQKRDDLPGIDLRGDGGLVVAPPSIHENGNRYEWVKGYSLDDLPLADLPEWILSTKPEHKATLTELLNRGAAEGNRNDALTRVAGSVISKGMPLDDAIQFCTTWNTLNTPPLPENELMATVRSIYTADTRNNGGRAATTQPAEWPPPSPLPEGLSPVLPLNPDIIPEPMRGWILDIADRMQIPPDFSAAAAVVALGSIIGRSCGILPKHHDDWLVIPNLWGAVVGRPSLMKTPAVSEAQRHLVRLESEAREEFLQATQAFEIDKEIRKITRSAVSEDIKKAVKQNKNFEEARSKLVALQVDQPVRQRYQTQDGTTEKIGELLIQNPRGLLVNRDELIGWLHTLDRDGREGDRSFYLEGWNGNRGFTYDRIGRGTLDIPALCLSVFGAITPGPLSSYVYQANRGGQGDDGLLQRFQVIVWPDAPAEWKNVDRFPDTTEKNRAWRIFKSLSGEIPGAVREEGADIPALRFSPAGQEVFDAWRHELETRLRGNHGLPPALESHLTKYRKLMPSLALIFHLVDVADGKNTGSVSEVSAVSAVRWSEYLESHAGRVYGATTSPGMESARELVKHIRRGAIQDGVKSREIYRSQWSRLTIPEEVRCGLEILEQYDWLTIERVTTGGRPSEIIRLNPHIKI